MATSTSTTRRRFLASATAIALANSTGLPKTSEPLALLEAEAPHPQISLPGIYYGRLTSDSMAPRFHAGDTFFFDPALGPVVGSDAIAEMSGPGQKAFVFRVTAIEGDLVSGMQFNRPEQIEFEMASVSMCARVLPTDMLLALIS